MKNKTLSVLSMLLTAMLLATTLMAQQPEITVVEANLAKERLRSLLLRPPQGVTYLVVAPQKFLSTVLPLARLRQQQGQQVKCVALEAVIAIMGKGDHPLRRFLGVVMEQWPAPALKFVVLAADTTTDSAIIPGIPTLYVKDYLGQLLASDHPYVETVTDTGSVMVGRLPARNVKELQAMVAKIVEYEERQAVGLWQRRVSFIAGEGNYGATADSVLEGIVTNLLTSYIPGWYDVTMTYANPNSPYFFPARRFPQLVTERMNEGALFMVYIGHGSRNSLGQIAVAGQNYEIFHTRHVSEVEVTQGFPVMVSVACSTGYFDDRRDCLGEALIKRRRGPVAFIGSSRISHPYGNILLGKAMLNAIFQEHAMTVGELLRQTRHELFKPPLFDVSRYLIEAGVGYFAGKDLPMQQLRNDHAYLYNLLGDPATRICFADSLQDFTVARTMVGSQETLTITGAATEILQGSQIYATCEVPLNVILKPATTATTTASGPDQHDQTMAAYRQANDKVVATQYGTVPLQHGTEPLPRWQVVLKPATPLATGEYLIKIAILAPDGLRVGVQMLIVGKN